MLVEIEGRGLPCGDPSASDMKVLATCHLAEKHLRQGALKPHPEEGGHLTCLEELQGGPALQDLAQSVGQWAWSWHGSYCVV